MLVKLTPGCHDTPVKNFRDAANRLNVHLIVNSN